jgi:hypothetical protein
MCLLINNVLQWTGTACFITMYSIMSFFPHLTPWNIVMGCAGGMLFLAWSIRVANRPQLIVNAVGVTVCIAGLVRAWS